ncbi:hypothetical protein GJ496_005115 [Pomphorhynchus laevis]|nr:hypothetical protein GJ496_005115 [Pomphorhynchus laevis]
MEIEPFRFPRCNENSKFTNVLLSSLSASDDNAPRATCIVQSPGVDSLQWISMQVEFCEDSEQLTESLAFLARQISIVEPPSNNLKAN